MNQQSNKHTKLNYMDNMPNYNNARQKKLQEKLIYQLLPRKQCRVELPGFSTENKYFCDAPNTFSMRPSLDQV